MRILLLTADAAAVAPLRRLCGAGHRIETAVIGENPPLRAGYPPEFSVEDAAAVVHEHRPDLVLGTRSATDRILLGGLAGLLRHPIVPRLVSVGADATLVAARFGGRAEGTVRVIDTTIACADIASPRRVVGVGRGVQSLGELDLCRDLAAALDAELVCTRPIAEVSRWLPRSAYVGVSGRRIAPDLYVAVGISGQLQHTLGVRGAGTIVAINVDPSAPIMAECDHGIVGDLREVLPDMIRELRR